MQRWRLEIFVSLVIIGAATIWCIWPMHLFTADYASAVYDRKHQLIGVRIAGDEQWRFPPPDSLSDKYKTALLCFEDKRFYMHQGVDPFAIIRAVLQNLTSGEIVSGGSTISMQVIRIAHGNPPRNIVNKLLESLLAMKLELQYSKDDILQLYSGHAPFGGNIVGIEAATWRYFGRPPTDISWAEAALLAVLPNTPSAIHVNKNRPALKDKRDRLLKKLSAQGSISELEYELATEEALPDELQAFPNLAPHLSMRLTAQHPDMSRMFTCIDRNMQQRMLEVIDSHHRTLRKNGIHNAALIVVETESGKVRAYVGNTGNFTKTDHENYVDMIRARRSTGSILKPFLYAAATGKGKILPGQLIPDYPRHFGSYKPQNYALGYDGAVSANRMIVRSLNVPAVFLLKEYGVPSFLEDLQKLGIRCIDKSADHYGLSLILGGSEARLDQVSAAYASMARSLMHYHDYNARFSPKDYHGLYYLSGKENSTPASKYSHKESFIPASGIFSAFEAMKNLQRPDNSGNWRYFSSSRPIAWKTGTSYGFRDAWAIGVTPEYVIGVWAGNADGEARPGLIGIQAAAPLLFDAFSAVHTEGQWFEQPFDDMIQMPVCRQTGFLKGPHCEKVDSVWIPVRAALNSACPYHRLIHLDETASWRVNSSCYPQEKIIHKNWLVLPPAIQWYYRQKHPEYRPLPTYLPACNSQNNPEDVLQIIYPEDRTKIFQVRGLSGADKKLVFEAAHQNPDAILYWYVDDRYIGKTERQHSISLRITPGTHVLSITDQNGLKRSHRFEILDTRK